MSDIIKNYNFKQTFSPCFSSKNDTNFPLFGCEIEVDCGGELDENAQECINILAPIEAITKHDGSLNSGFEINVAPMTFERYLEENSTFKKLFSFLVEKGYRAHDTSTCGLHIHVNREAFGSSPMKQSENISKIGYLFTFHKQIIIDFARRKNNKYAKYYTWNNPLNSPRYNLYEMYNNMKNTGKYTAINLNHKDTFEFRIFKGTLNIDTFYLCLSFVNTLITIANDLTPEQIFSLSDNEFIELFPQKIQEYIKVRRQKRIQKENKCITEKNRQY